MQVPALLATEEGSLFPGYSIGVEGVTTGELVFNTSSTGYQETLSDPSYCQQIITFTHTHIGNVGVNEADLEATKLWSKGLVVKELSPMASNWRAQKSLGAWLVEHEIVGIAGVDTRQLTRLLREQGALKACIVAGADLNAERAVQRAQEFPGLLGMDLAQKVTCQQAYAFTTPSWPHCSNAQAGNADPLHVVVFDFGVKRSILHQFVDRGVRVTVVPATTTAAEVLALLPDGILFSNGPGDPAPCQYAIKTLKQLLETDVPLLGICLGLQLLALALGAKTEKMKFGHHGANHPVQDLSTGKVMITTQNHGFAVSEDNLPEELTITHRSLFDNSIQGLCHRDKPVFGFQGHPEAGPGPQDALNLFDQFTNFMSNYRSQAAERQMMA